MDLPLRGDNNYDEILSEDLDSYCDNNYGSENQVNQNESNKHIEKEIRLENNSSEAKAGVNEPVDPQKSNEEKKLVQPKEKEQGGYYAAYRKSKKSSKSFLQ